MEWFDIIYILPIALAGVYGFYKGFLTEAFKLIALIVAIICCLKFTAIITSKLNQIFNSHKWIPFFAYLITAGLSFFFVIQLGNMVRKGLALLKLKLIDQLVGAVLGVTQASFFASLTIWFMDNIHIIGNQTKSGSIVFSTLRPFAPFVVNSIVTYLPSLESLVQEINKSFAK